MANIRTIVTNIEEHFCITCEGRLDKNLEITSVKRLNTDNISPSAYDFCCLYVCDYETFLHAPIHENVIVTAAPEGFSSKEHPNHLFCRENLSLRDLEEFILGVISNNHLMKLNREHLFRSLYQGGGLKGILQVAYEHLQNTITICDTSFKVMDALPFYINKEHFHSEKGSWYLNDVSLKSMIKHKVIDHLYHSKTPIQVKFDDSDHHWIFSSISIKNAVVGYVCIFNTQNAFSKDDIEYVQVLSQILALEFQKQNTFAAPTGLKYEFFLTELLRGSTLSPTYISKRLNFLGYRPEKYFSVLCLRFDDPETTSTVPSAYYEDLLSLIPKSMVVFYEGYLTVVFSHAEVTAFSEETKERLNVFLLLNHMMGFVSYPYKNLADSTRFLKQSMTMLHFYRKKESLSKLIYYGDFYFDHLFTLACQYSSPSALEDSIHPIIRSIQEYDMENNTEYLMTLKTFLHNNCNVAQTANFLHIHKSTFFYRLNKITDLFHFDVNDHATLFAFEYSLSIIDYLKEQKLQEIENNELI